MQDRCPRGQPQRQSREPAQQVILRAELAWVEPRPRGRWAGHRKSPRQARATQAGIGNMSPYLLPVSPPPVSPPKYQSRLFDHSILPVVHGAAFTFSKRRIATSALISSCFPSRIAASRSSKAVRKILPSLSKEAAIHAAVAAGDSDFSPRHFA